MAFAMRPVGLLVVAILVIADAASGRRLQEPVTACESCRLRLDVATDKITYDVGEPIVISIRLTDVGSSPGRRSGAIGSDTRRAAIDVLRRAAKSERSNRHAF